MREQDLSNLTKKELIKMLLKQNDKIKLLFNKVNQLQKPVPVPQKNVKQMVQDYEDNIIPPPLEFRDDYKPVPKPRTIKPIPASRRSVKKMAQDYEKNIIPPIPKPRTKKPVPLPRTKIEQVARALKGYTKSFEIGIKYNKDPLKQLQNTRKAIEHHIESLLTSMKGIKFVETLSVTFTKFANGETIYKTAYFNSKPQTIINNTEIPKALQLSKQQILNMIAQWISEGSGVISDS